MGRRGGVNTASLVASFGVSASEKISLREQVAALKHDLAKYVAWRSSNLGEEAWEGTLSEELVEALRADLLRTREKDGVGESAWEVWGRLSAELPRPWEDELQRVGEAVAVLEASGELLREGGSGLQQYLPKIRAAQGVIRAQLRSLHRRLQREANEACP